MFLRLFCPTSRLRALLLATVYFYSTEIDSEVVDVNSLLLAESSHIYAIPVDESATPPVLGDGSELISKGGTKVAVAVDNVRGNIYWSDHGTHTVNRAALNGSNPEVIVNGVYLGCFNDSARVLTSRTYEMPTTNSPLKCVSLCAMDGYSFAGLENGTQCLCGSSSTGAPPAPKTACDMPCPGDNSQMCGGSELMDLYNSNTLKAYGLAVDAETGNIYFTNRDKIEVVNADGTERNIVIDHSDGQTIRGLAIDATERLLFHTVTVICKSFLNGTKLVEIVSRPYSMQPCGIAIEYYFKKIWWVDYGNQGIRCSNYDGSNVETVPITRNNLRFITIEDNTIYYTEEYTKNLGICQLDFKRCTIRNLRLQNLLMGIAVMRDKEKVLREPPPLKADPPVKKELLMRLNDGDPSTCLDLAHTDHYTFMEDMSFWDSEPQGDCWLPGLLVKMAVPGQIKKSFTISISGHHLVCSESHFRVIIRAGWLDHCVVAGEYSRCKLSGPVDGDGVTTCAASCGCEGEDCRYVFIHMLHKYDDWKICEIKLE